MSYEEDTIKKWCAWLGNVRNQVSYLLHYKEIFDETQEIIKKNPSIQKPSAFYDFLGKGYVALILTGIRRQTKSDSDSISLIDLLYQIKKDAHIVTRKRFVALFTNLAIAGFTADKDFDRFSVPGQPHIDPNLVEKDINALKDAVRTLEDYIDKRLVHTDRRKPKSIPTFKDVDNALKSLDDLIKRYTLLLTAASWMTLKPTIQYNWKVIFKEKWIPDKPDHAA